MGGHPGIRVRCWSLPWGQVKRGTGEREKTAGWPLGHGAGSLQAFPEEEDGRRVPGSRRACVQEGRGGSPGTFSWEALGLTLQLASCWPFCSQDPQDTRDPQP